MVDAPPDAALNLPTGDGLDPAPADAVIGFVVHREDMELLDAVYAAANNGRLAWVSYPKPGRLDTDVHREWLFRALREHGVDPVDAVSVDDTWAAVLVRPGLYTDADVADLLAWPPTDTVDQALLIVAAAASDNRLEPIQLTIQHELRDDAVVVHFQGDIDMTVGNEFSSHLKMALDTALAHSRRVLIIDVEAVTFLASAGVNAVLACHHQGISNGIAVGLAAANPVVMRIIEVSGLSDVLALPKWRSGDGATASRNAW